MEIYKKCDEIEKQIHEIKGPNENILPISDGIINIEEYLKAKFKILWILKESNDVENDIGGGWNLPKAINELKCWEEQPRGGKITLQRMVYASYGILNNFISWKDMNSIYHKEVFETIKKIAYINVKKIPGNNLANGKLISQAYIENKELLFKQINTYNPDIIIAGNTLQYFINDLSIDTEKDKKFVNDITKNTTYYSYPEKLYIHAWHPAYFRVSEEVYCNEIILAAREWTEKWNKL